METYQVVIVFIAFCAFFYIFGYERSKSKWRGRPITINEDSLVAWSSNLTSSVIFNYLGEMKIPNGDRFCLLRRAEDGRIRLYIVSHDISVLYEDGVVSGDTVVIKPHSRDSLVILKKNEFKRAVIASE